MSFPANSAHFASIDIGSHTLRLLVASCKEVGEATDKKILLSPLCLERRITRLARGFQIEGMLKETGIRDSIRALKEYTELLKHYQVRSVTCGATGVIRRASNNTDFLKMILEETGLQVSIISESSEAFLSAKGVLSALAKPEHPVLIFDLGGSSTEFVLTDPKQPEPIFATSVFIGAATVTERCLQGDPPDEESIREARQAIRTALEPTLKTFSNRPDRPDLSPSRLQTVGTAGTITTLAAMHLEMDEYEAYRVNNLQLSETWLDQTIDRLAHLTLASRRKLPGLEEGREDIIFGGALIVREILHLLGEASLTVIDAGFLEGLLLDLIEKEYGVSSSLWSPLTWHWQKG